VATPVYCTREDIKSALDIAATSLTNTQIDREIDASSRAIDGRMRRVFYPTDATRTFDWLDHQYSLTWRLWLDSDELASVPTAVLTNGVSIVAGILARPDSGPPYNRLEINLSSSSAFTAGDTYQRAISVTGTYGYTANESQAGTLTAAVSSTSATTISINEPVLIGVGSILHIDSERLIVTDRSWTTTATGIVNTLTADKNSVTVQVADGTIYRQGEFILIDSETMLITAIAGSNLTVKRGVDGSVLAAHANNATIYRSTTLTVARGQLGSTAATHNNSTAIYVHTVPSLIRTLCVGETMVHLGLERAGYIQTIARGETTKVGVGIDDLWTQAIATYQRKIRTRTAGRFL